MKKWKIKAIAMTGILGAALMMSSWTSEKNTQSKETGRKIQIAILFDTSNSMDGLIDQAKSRIWNIVNTMSNLSHNQQIPEIEIALYEYGNDFLEEKKGFVRQVLPLSTDMDLISEQLFGLATNGGSEYCGTVIDRAIKDLKWTNQSGDIRIIYIAGNEPFDQGNVDYKASCRNAAKKDIKVHTIYCGDRERGIKELWYEGAVQGKGEYSNINSDLEVVQYKTPYDEEIKAYNDSLNGTYLMYGKKGIDYRMNQLKQDSNALSISENVQVERTVAKAKESYLNDKWDLVDAQKVNENFDIDEVKEEELPEELKNKTTEEKKQIIAVKEADRKRFQQKIGELSSQRQAFITDLKKKEEPKESDLGEEINLGIKKLAVEKGYELKQP
ncbi:MAG: VWA domain-containing protein [Bacteroidetes bacterium]|nr:MAG: VWA domain-containing protein [Bacteroidota bacterium]